MLADGLGEILDACLKGLELTDLGIVLLVDAAAEFLDSRLAVGNVLQREMEIATCARLSLLRCRAT